MKLSLQPALEYLRSLNSKVINAALYPRSSQDVPTNRAEQKPRNESDNQQKPASEKQQQARAHQLVRKMLNRKLSVRDNKGNIEGGDASTRKNVSLTTIAPGIIHVRLQGDGRFFENIGMPDIQTASGDKTVEYLSIRDDKFAPHLSGGKKIYRPTNMNASKLLKLFSKTSTSSPVAYINGGFYNSAHLGAPDLPIQKQIQTPEHASIAKSKVIGVKLTTHIQPQEKYANDYHRIDFADGSYLTSGPLLAQRNTNLNELVCAFTTEKAADNKYFLNTQTDRPGQLGHANDPHPRSGISMPNETETSKAFNPLSAKTNNIRIAIGVDNGAFKTKSLGFTMSEWSTVMRKLGSINENPGISLNLDGGASSVLGVIDASGRKLLEVRGAPHTTPTTTTFVVFKGKYRFTPRL